ncbi:E3 ubiquitin-protein ligase RING1a [Pyrus ussuriensis x Pyrus communis]|uniref:E3 ubiquitin-protein ligase RING1a n=1 Tax=Pyrus ussuriensis x Pyrus communis TaxID=2448454 RepID=A0A5N5EZW4_9ROSA|nr:E3 ubiquitin-protein ligase RING1a [Pyrus ussuriensis x Pyrus communis]
MPAQKRTHEAMEDDPPQNYRENSHETPQDEEGKNPNLISSIRNGKDGILRMCGDGEQLKRGQRQDMEVVLEKKDAANWEGSWKKLNWVLDVGFLFCVSVFSSIRALPNLMACVLLSNIGASITEVAQDALVADLQSMPSALHKSEPAFYFLVHLRQPDLSPAHGLPAGGSWHGLVPGPDDLHMQESPAQKASPELDIHSSVPFRVW